MITNQEKAKNILLDKSIKPTAQRIAVLSYLLSTKTHPTIEEIYENIKPSIPTLSKTTLYNTLQLFSQKGAALSLNIDSEQKRFDGFVEPHSHFYCTKCGKVYDINKKFDFANSRESFYNDIGKVESFHAYFYGTCKDCLKTERRKK